MQSITVGKAAWMGVGELADVLVLIQAQEKLQFTDV